MSTFKIHTYPNNPRVWKAAIAGQYSGVTLEESIVQMGVTNKTKEFLAINPLGKVPTLEGAEGAVWESNAIAIYVARQGDGGKQLFGSNAYEEALVHQWMNWAMSEVELPGAAWLYPIFGLVAENKEATGKARADIRKQLKVLNDHLELRTFLVGERITLADIVVSMTLLPLYKLVLDPGFRKAFGNTNRWFTTLINQPQFAAVIKDFSFATTMAKAKAVDTAAASKPTPAKKETVKKEPAKAPAKKKTPRDEFNALPKAEYKSLAPFKATYVNSDWATESKPEFEKDILPAVARNEYSLWFVNYKHPKDQQKLFMACNMVGGMFQRMEHVRDWALGSMLIFGDDNSEEGLEIIGAFIFRGDKVPECVEDTADYMVYDYTKVDPSNAEDMKFFCELLAWEGDFRGKKYRDGKMFK